MYNAPPVWALEGVSKRVLLVEFFNPKVCGGSNITPSDSDVRILGHHAYIFTEWGMNIISFTGIGVPSMEYTNACEWNYMHVPFCENIGMITKDAHIWVWGGYSTPSTHLWIENFHK